MHRMGGVTDCESRAIHAPTMRLPHARTRHPIAGRWGAIQGVVNRPGFGAGFMVETSLAGTPRQVSHSSGAAGEVCAFLDLHSLGVGCGDPV